MIGIFYGLVFMNLLFVTSTVCLMALPFLECVDAFPELTGMDQ